MKIIITLSGHSKRFTDEGYPENQLVNILGKRVIEHVVNMFSSLYDISDYHFILKNDDNESADLLQKIYQSPNIHYIPSHAKGPCHSILECDFHFQENEEIIVSYCDIEVKWDIHTFVNYCRASDSDGVVVTHVGFHPHRLYNKSFAFIKSKGRQILGIQEKIPYTDNIFNEHASSGIYYFKSFKSMVHYFNKTIEAKDVVKGEFYVTLPYNHMIKDNKKITLYEVDNFFSFGTPQDIELIAAWNTIHTKANINNDHELHQSSRYWRRFLG